MASNASLQDSAISAMRNGTISNLQVVKSDPSSGVVELAGEVSKPIRFQGRLDDTTVQQLLFNALRDAQNPGSRSKAVEVLSQKPKEEAVEQALINALVYDEDAGVRATALDGLKKYASEQHVRAAFMHALQNDKSPNIRVEAIDALTKENPKDPSLAETLQEVTKRDDNPYVQTKALQYVSAAK
jgi:HEAT repeat protein